MNHNSKVHSSSQGNIPFSWENQPGISKVKHPTTDGGTGTGTGTDTLKLTKLPPPPFQSDSSSSSSHHKGVGHQDMQVPLPPCPFQPPVRTSSRKGIRRQDNDDPFLAAYKECTKTGKQSAGKLSKSKSGKRSGADGHREGMFDFGSIFSCKLSGVREDNLVKKLSHRHSSISPPFPKQRHDSDAE